MPDIRYVCLSDLHLGEEDSLLTKLKLGSSDVDWEEPSPVMVQLVACLKYLISKNEDQEKKPTLILNGDILELALTTTNVAAMVFERFMELIMPSAGELFERVIYVPGNHDHHIWEIARETQYVHYIRKPTTSPCLEIPWHTTNMFVEDDVKRVPSYFLTNLVKRSSQLADFPITTAYPNFGLLGEDGQKGVIFHHGHFIDPLYQLMSCARKLIFRNRKMPEDIWDIEAENFAWIDFFWSTLGRSGKVGGDIEVIYEKMQDKEQLKKLLHTFAHRLAEKYDVPFLRSKMGGKALKWCISKGVDRKYKGMERSRTDALLSKDAKKGLKAYMNVPLMKQIRNERNQNMPADIAFVFGHTHKPFQKDRDDFEQYPGWVSVYNTGGWVVDTVEPEPVIGGAIILVDENLNTTSLRMYNQVRPPAKCPVRVEEAIHHGKESSPFHNRILGLVNPDEEPWKTFSDLVADDVPVRAKNLLDRIRRGD